MCVHMSFIIYLIKLLWNWVLCGVWLRAEPLGGGFHPPFGSVLGVNPSSAIPPAGSTMSVAKKGWSCWSYTLCQTTQ